MHMGTLFNKCSDNQIPDLYLVELPTHIISNTRHINTASFRTKLLYHENIASINNSSTLLLKIDTNDDDQFSSPDIYSETSSMKPESNYPDFSNLTEDTYNKLIDELKRISSSNTELLSTLKDAVSHCGYLEKRGTNEDPSSIPSTPNNRPVSLPSPSLKSPITPVFGSPLTRPHSLSIRSPSLTSPLGLKLRSPSFLKDKDNKISNFLLSVAQQITGITPPSETTFKEDSDIALVDIPDLCKGLLTFGPDSPFFKNELGVEDERLYLLSRNLQRVHKIGKNYLESYVSVSNASKELLSELTLLDWEEVEFAVGSEWSFSTCLKQICDLVREGEASREILIFALENSFLKPISEFYKLTIPAVKENYRLLLKMSNDYEYALHRYLLTPKNNNISQLQDPSWLAIRDSYTLYNQSRFDLSFSLTALHTEKKIELLEHLWTVQHHFFSYYHSGFEFSKQNVDVYTTNILPVLTDKKDKSFEMRRVANIFRHCWWASNMQKLDSNEDNLPSILAVRRFAQKFPEKVEPNNSQVSGFSYLFPPIPSKFECSNVSLPTPPPSPLSNFNDDALDLPEFSSEASYFIGNFSFTHPIAISRSGQIIEKYGYLSKQTTSIIKDWKRRWFHLKKGSLYYYRSAKESDCELVVNVLLCTVRECQNELRNCFEIISPNRRVYVLQADTEYDMRRWIKIIQNCTEYMLTNQDENSFTHSTNSNKPNHFDLQSRVELENKIPILKALNPYCVDCSSSDPEWYSINLGVAICIECSGVHRSLGVHISKVRSLTLDGWDSTLLQVMENIGNDYFNSIWEGARTDDPNYLRQLEIGAKPSKPSANASRELKEEWIKLKYSDKAFLTTQCRIMMTNIDLLKTNLFESAKKNDVYSMLPILATGIDINSIDENQNTALHIACEFNNAITVEYLLQNNACSSMMNNKNQTPLQVAESNKSNYVITLFKRKGL